MEGLLSDYKSLCREREDVCMIIKQYIPLMQHVLVVYHGISHESLVFSRYTLKPRGECVHISYQMFWCVVSLYIFTSCAVFWRARRASPNINNEYKYTAILHTKTSTKRFIIQLLLVNEFISERGRIWQFCVRAPTCPANSFATVQITVQYRCIFVLISRDIWTVFAAVG